MKSRRLQHRRIVDVGRLVRRRISLDSLEPYVQIGLRSFGRGVFHYEPVTGDRLGRLRYFAVKPGDLVFSNIKAWEGAVAVAGESEAGCIASNRFLTYVVDSSIADARYLKYFFLSEPGLTLIQRASPGSADRNRTLAIERLEQLEFPLPPIEEQRRVATKLDRVLLRVRRLKVQTERSLDAVQALKWGVLRDAFERLSQSHPPVAVGDAIQVNPETANAPLMVETTFKYVNIGSVENGTGRIGVPQEVATSDAPSRARRRIRAGDVLISTVRPNLRGFAKVPSELDGAICSTGFAVLRPGSAADSEFLLLQAMSDVFVNQLVGESRGGHYPAVRDAVLRAATVTLPDVCTQRAVVREVMGLTDRIEAAQREIRRRLLLSDALERSTLEHAFRVDP